MPESRFQAFVQKLGSGSPATSSGETVIEPRVHLEPRAGVDGHFNVLRGWIGGAIDAAGVKVIGDFVDNHLHGLPSECGILTLYDSRTGVELSMSAFHHGSTFEGTIEVDDDEGKFLRAVMRDGWCPVFIAIDTKALTLAVNLKPCKTDP